MLSKKCLDQMVDEADASLAGRSGRCWATLSA